MSWKTELSRRPFLAAVAGALGLGVVGGLIYEAPRFLRKRYPPTPYDDILDQLYDRENAAKLGRAAKAEVRGEAPSDAGTLSKMLRDGPGKGSLAKATEADLAEARMLIVQGWIVPESVAAAALIAASVQ